MATTRRYHNIDENETQLNIQMQNKAAAAANTVGVLKAGKQESAGVETRRVALGQLNKGNLQSAAVQQKTLKQFKDVKPKVDTHWKRIDSKLSGPVVLPKLNATTTSSVPVATVPGLITATDAGKKVIPRPIQSSAIAPPARPAWLRKATTTSGGDAKPVEAEQVSLAAAAALSHTSKLLSDISVEDIDAKDKENQFLLSEYVCDIYDYLQSLEKVFPVRENYLKDHAVVDARMRGVLIEWINEVHYQFKLLPETYFMTIGLIDRYLQEDLHLQRKHLQLVGTAALFISSKFEELYPPLLDDFVYVTDNTYTAQQVIEMERQILKTLKFELCRPVTIQFLRRYSKAAHSDQNIHLLSKYFIELASVDYTMCHYPQSMVAAASLYLALIILRSGETVGEDSFLDYWRNNNNNDDSAVVKKRSPAPLRQPLWTGTLEHYSNYREAALRPLVKRLAAFVVAAPKTKACKSIYNKYASQKFERFSQLPQLSGSLITELATAAVGVVVA